MADVVATRAAGLAQLAAILPTLGEVYARGRNTDPGDRARPSTSLLSPWLRYRLLTEQEVVGAALAAHGPGAGKFVEEVFWRSYWKGWLEGRPSVWDAYGAELARAQDRLATEGGLRRVYRDATEGTTGIDGFDDWARALVAENWLHNHARMWFASIWVFTLRLPWALGAAFFLRHLLDGDPASNTLSWRWVAGLHTRGKHYVARAENIARYTGGRHDPAGQLDENPAPLTESEAPPAHRLPPADPAQAGDVALLLHEDDCAVETLPLGDARVRALAGFSARRGAAPVEAFAQAAVHDALARAEARFGVPGRLLAPDALAGWTDRLAGLPVVTPHAPVGPVATALASLPATRMRRDWDALTWPHAARGFFQLRTRIPDLLDALGLPGGAVS